MKYFFLRLFLVFIFLSGLQQEKLLGQPCLTPNLSFTNTPTGPAFYFNCNPGPCQGTLYLEYGPHGFTPGTNLNPGPLGTIVSLPPFGPFFPSGLPPSTYYDSYVRQDCGTSWSANDGPEDFTTPPDCNIAPLLGCGILNTVPGDTGAGAWSYTCSGYPSQGREKIYKFLPSYSGMHQVFIQINTQSNNNAVFYYKEANLGCDATGWNCIGGSTISETEQILFGPLTAGTLYYIRADLVYDQGPVSNINFKIECPSCTAPTGVTVVASPYVLDVNWTGSSFGVEVGYPNFIPGTGNDTGITSYVLPNTAYVYDLSASSYYDIYVRCGGITGMNSSRVSAPTPPCPFIPFNGLGVDHLIWSDGTGYNWYGSTGPSQLGILEGSEKIIQFASTINGFLEASIYYDLSMDYGFGMKISNGNCKPSGYSSPSPYYSSGSGLFKYLLGPFTKDTIYDFFVDMSDTSTWGGNYVYLNVHCPTPDSVIVNYVQPTEVEMSWFSYYDSVFVEYGPPFFTPGTGDTPGTGGTLLSSTTGSLTISNLTANTKYEYYIRNKCGGTFSPNSPKKYINTQNTCNVSPIITCNSTLGIFWPNGDEGVWEINSCLSQNYNGREKVFQFVAQDSGMHYVYVVQDGWYSWNTGIFYREATTGCSDTGWVCVGNNFTPPELFSFGPLDAGKTYYLMLDAPDLISGGVNKWFYFYCPAPCLPPISANIVGLTDTSITLNTVFMDTVGTVMIEYGPPGFTPGTDSVPGPGGTITTFLSPPYEITGLTPATYYDFYIRQQCISGTGFSTNYLISSHTLASNCAIGPSHIQSNNGDTVCAGQTTQLSAQGVIGSMNGYPDIIWYLDSCFSTPIDTADFIYINPQVTNTYYAIAHDSCGFTNCVAKTINVLPNIPVTISTPPGALCEGESKILDAGQGYSQYMWSTGEITHSIVVYTPGNITYTVTVTSANGCTSLDDEFVIIYSNPAPVIIGDTAQCQSINGSLNAGTGYTNYLWSTGDTTQIISITQPGGYSVVVTGNAGCTRSDSVFVNILPEPNLVITGDSTLCPGDSVYLDAGSGFTSYQWSTGNATQIIQLYTPGVYSVIVTDGNGCTADDSFNVFSVSSPVVVQTALGNPNICQGDSIELSSTPGFPSYQWFKNNSAITGASLSNYFASTTGNYICAVTDSNGCTGNSNTIRVRVVCIPTGPNHERVNLFSNDAAFEFQVMPNPSTDGFVFTIKNNSSPQVDIFIYDESGRMVQANIIKRSADTYYLAKLPPGFYFAEVVSGNEFEDFKNHSVKIKL